MEQFFKEIQSINAIEDAISKLKTQIEISPKLYEIINFIIEAHEGQFRKSGEPYCVHPVLVAAITAHFSKDESVIATALLHDVVEDTEYTLDFVREKWGNDIAIMVDGLTKIVEIREHEFVTASDATDSKIISSALTFRKMLIASIDDVRVLVVKLCDRLHNMLTLNVLPPNKQKRIAEETLVVYVPIANRLGISTLKNALEDLAFFYIYPNEYKKIDNFLKEQEHAMQLTFNNFISTTKNLLEKNGYDLNKIKIYSRIKHHYSIYLKMQRKGISIDEVLDLFAIRILVENDIDCYKVLGFIHLEFKPLISRFKDYVATPKENGYQTIHTTVFYNSKIYEIQIRSFEMNKIAEYGIAAHWMYKSGVKNTTNLNWLKSLEFSNENIEEFYQETKDNLYTQEIIVYSPKGEVFTLPVGSTAYDFAFAVHSNVGKKAIACYINKIKKPLLTVLKSTDIVSIETGDDIIVRCSWIDMVQTSRAKKQIKFLCTHRQREIDEMSGKNILNTVFSRYYEDVTKIYPIESLYKVPLVLDFFKNSKQLIEKNIVQDKGLMTRFKILTSKIKEFKFDNMLIYSNFSITSVSFDHCCHPKFGDDIVAFRNNNEAIIHHKMCDKAYNKIKNNHQMLFCKWTKNSVYQYKMVISIPNTRGELAKVLTYMAENEFYILGVDFGRQKHSYIQYCDIEFEANKSNIDEVKKIIEKKVKVIEFFSKKDAYNK
ncbi:RelA/SpoT family protein [Arcobacter aquimarinus]|uniref:PpGpp synthetase / guanosine-3',5'-bis(Diphosphate) 3' pyrophosphohydrolase n=1 Tax=Arcobacter aquimarinus TaxID=1315211 RepID=A0AAE7E1V4_9BACT|nr:RelA/SpoT family protein [Arcobacter aquimarinus]MCB9096482.1 bifunctional (p)ppGpp synthetase/guanosine-3',5'-bis(diphosphate) 3'-pyrophosphohydrolase [Arcobacter sp.]QKE26514.1 ppGpp synthetase / guanosine-3',5'-bis(diphosphate) 3' pyrophosphohydrolase [Arcobacter aquimarinus]RXI34112.1 bifunctional (p)ppGpp synthase/hydrolase [Arcobacter aquimarinus]